MIAKILRDLRMSQKVPARMLAEKVGMNNAYVSQIETGRIKHPHLATFKKMLTILGCSEEQIKDIIITEFADVEKNPQSHCKNKTDYKIERKIILSGKEEKNYVTENSSTKTNYLFQSILTKKQYQEKCEQDALDLYYELKELPKETLEKLLTFLYDDI